VYQEAQGNTVLDLAQFTGATSGAVFDPGNDLQIMIRETLPNLQSTALPGPFLCSAQAVPFFTAQYTNVDSAGAGLMGPYVPRVDYTPLASGAGLPQPALTLLTQLPDPGQCGVLPSYAPTANAPSLPSNTVSWPTYWPNQGDDALPLVCGKNTSGSTQAAPSFVASLVSSEDYGSDCSQALGQCNYVNYLTPQSTGFSVVSAPNGATPPVPITIVGSGFGYLSQILPYAGPASSLVVPNTSTALLRVQDCIGGGSNCQTWDTATATACQIYLANWADSSVSLDVNLPTGTVNGMGNVLSPLTDVSPWTFFPDGGNMATQQCPVNPGDTLQVTVANAQGGGQPSSVCVSIGTPGQWPCNNF
jgi:hypothetical protein